MTSDQNHQKEKCRKCGAVLDTEAICRKCGHNNGKRPDVEVEFRNFKISEMLDIKIPARRSGGKEEN